MISKHTILSRFGYQAYRPLQEEAIDALCSGNDVLLMAPTGGGKSLVYQSAGLIRDGIGIIISPLLSLMAQQVETLRKTGVNAYFFNSALNIEEQDDLVWALRHDQVDLLFMSPEKIVQPAVIGFLKDIQISIFAIDEAHCIAQWGEAFRPEYSQLGTLRTTFPKVPIIALTGTVDLKTIQTIENSLQISGCLLLKNSFDRVNIEIQIAQKRKAKQQILYFLHHEMAGEKGIIYCRSRKKTQELASWLESLGLTSLPYHAAMQEQDKQKHHQRFLNEPGVIMVATTAYGMGIDVPDIRFVIHFDLPSSPEAYFQEVGRAGRDGKPAKSLLLYGLQDMLQAQQFGDGENYERLSALFKVLESRGCRRKNLLSHFGEEIAPCGHCDRCLSPSSEQNATIAAQKILSLIYYTKGIQPFSVLVDVLLGKHNKGVMKIHGETLSLFGKGREFTDIQWKAVIRHLIGFGYIKVDHSTTFCVHLNQKAKRVLKGEEQILLPHERYYPVLDENALHKELIDWHKLKAWKSRDQNNPLSDRQLRLVQQHKPSNVASLSRLTGLSIEVISSCADQLLAIMNEVRANEE
ncbi:ATP-dependent DNA helicase RecQ [Marinomonas spartinae]|uniref:ATP-dependent DNA helicase RecQ n=1 Tax=Marinomonas spartinae TaxID=1792290 RepID=A0A1A8TMT5_9GAMM|nr:RecQ family ATP-dependent DNA helicase [Marinomonas spartinae]SBS33932.1 ATP-dependent DNA helicase RecQ [Marinomonas spartinae]SBS37971.1 ATP-dependent DNA helicase RecQ [Marinomonas spartinae]